MKITYNWLKQYVDFHWTPEELAERLTMLGMEVESIQRVGNEFDGIVVARVESIAKHPNADKLLVCQVNDGTGIRQVVCGAHNFKQGDKVALILPGHALPKKGPDGKPLVIKSTKIRGVESHGMLCSEEELGLADKSDGIMVLSPDAQLGQPFAAYLGRKEPDVIYDLEITPNRPDLNGIIGIAREVAAMLDTTLKLPEIELPETGEPVNDAVSVQICEPTLCPRYTARLIRGVKVGPSPAWLADLLEKLGFRSINNVVDVTNYVMMETGQPLHAFDHQRLARDKSGRTQIIVRRAQSGEQFTTLDGQQRTLTDQMLLICDAARPVALAGVMGGQNSEIQPETTEVLIESANFNPVNIRRTAKALSLRTESSYRFERGVDIEMADWASRRCAQLILQTAGGTLARGVVDVYPGRQTSSRKVTLRFERTGALLGTHIEASAQKRILHKLGFELLSEDAHGGSATFAVPSWRVDVKREADLIEDIERIYGVENVPPAPPRGAVGTHSFDQIHDQIAEARTILCGLGLFEAQGQTLISEKAASRSTPSDALVRLSNPLSSEMTVLRPSLLPGLLDSLMHNVRHRNESVALFEIGRVFFRSGQPPRVKEERRLGLLLAGRRWPTFWEGPDRDARFDIYDLKGVIEEFLEKYGVHGVVFHPSPNPGPLFHQSATLLLGKNTLGEFGLLAPAVARELDLRELAVLGELNLDLLIKLRTSARTFEPLPQFPAVRRDLAIIVPEQVAHSDVLRVIGSHKPRYLESVELFDVFRGKSIPDGHKSMAYAFTYRAPDRTLTDAEVNQMHEQIARALQEKLKATIRA